jgi:hypothetical protein
MKPVGLSMLACLFLLFAPSVGRPDDTEVEVYTTQETSPGVIETYPSARGELDPNGNGTINSYDDNGNETGSTEIETDGEPDSSIGDGGDDN